MSEDAYITVMGTRYLISLRREPEPAYDASPWMANAYRVSTAGELETHVRFCSGSTRDDALARIKQGIRAMS